MQRFLEGCLLHGNWGALIRISINEEFERVTGHKLLTSGNETDRILRYLKLRMAV